MRLYAEDPRTFLPQAGRIERLRLPTAVRVDAGVEEGDEVGTRYDPLIAKLIAHGETRDEAIAKLRAALAETDVGGLVTNLPFLRWLVAHPSFRAGDTTTDFLTRHPPLSPPPPRRFPAWRRRLPPQPAAARRSPPPDVDDPPRTRAARAGEITAPMPGTVIRVLVAPGDEVAARQPLVVVEAMKMEMPLIAPRPGRRSRRPRDRGRHGRARRGARRARRVSGVAGLDVHREGPVLRLTLARPEKRNAFDRS